MIALLRARAEHAALILISAAGLAIFIAPLRLGTASAQSPALFASLVAAKRGGHRCQISS